MHELQSHKNLRSGLSSSTYLMVLQLFIAAKQITSWKCNFGRVWQGQLVFASLRISWPGSKTGAWSLLKQGISTSAFLTLWIGYFCWRELGFVECLAVFWHIYPLDASSTPSLVVKTKNCQMPPPWGEGGGNITHRWKPRWVLLAHVCGSWCWLLTKTLVETNV